MISTRHIVRRHGLRQATILPVRSQEDTSISKPKNLWRPHCTAACKIASSLRVNSLRAYQPQLSLGGRVETWLAPKVLVSQPVVTDSAHGRITRYLSKCFADSGWIVGNPSTTLADGWGSAIFRIPRKPGVERNDQIGRPHEMPTYQPSGSKATGSEGRFSMSDIVSNISFLLRHGKIANA
jgi:hypothetical protein